MRRLKQLWSSFFIIVFMCFIWGCAQEEGRTELREAEVSESPEGEDYEQRQEVDPEDEEEIYVYVCGAVNAPGVYRLSADGRVFEAIEAAGGMKEEAAFEYVNQAEVVSDGQQIYVPQRDEVTDPSVRGADREEDGRINLNTAGKEELMTLSGIGEVKAEAIIHYREEHGRFDSVEQLKQIEGIKEGVFNRIKDKVRI